MHCSLSLFIKQTRWWRCTHHHYQHRTANIMQTAEACCHNPTIRCDYIGPSSLPSLISDMDSRGEGDRGQLELGGKVVHTAPACFNAWWGGMQPYRVFEQWALSLGNGAQAQNAWKIRGSKYIRVSDSYSWLVFNGTFGTNRLYCAIGVWNASRRAEEQDMHIIKHWNNTLNQKNLQTIFSLGFVEMTHRHD